MSSAEAAFLQLNNSAIADSKSGNTATFSNKTLATIPERFRNLNIRDFEVYLNNRRISNNYVLSVVQSGLDIVITVNIAGFLNIPDAVFENDDEVLLIGKFA